MALHEVQVSESIIALEMEVFMLRETLDFILDNMDVLNIEKLDQSRLRRQAVKYVKDKFPDEDIRLGDWID